jgi:3-oxoacyl-[acyl-carrier protein] reductase
MLVDNANRRGMTWEAYLEAAADRLMGRIGQPGEIGRVALFLACDDSSFMTGTIAAKDGGGTA